MERDTARLPLCILVEGVVCQSRRRPESYKVYMLPVLAILHFFLVGSRFFISPLGPTLSGKYFGQIYQPR